MGDPRDGTGLGPSQDAVRVEAGRPEWSGVYRGLAEPLVAALGRPAVAVERIGSTSVPGLAAEPVVDIAAGTAPHADEAGRAEALAPLGHLCREDLGEDGGLLFVLESAPGVRVVHLHAVPRGGRQWRGYLAFRDRLRADPAARRAYEDLKRRLAAGHAGGVHPGEIPPRRGTAARPPAGPRPAGRTVNEAGVPRPAPAAAMMAGMTNESPNGLSLAEIRERVDALDTEVVGLLARRQRLVEAAAALKADEQAVRAPDRVERVVAGVRARAREAGLAPQVAEAVWRAMISAFVELELAEHRRAVP